MVISGLDILNNLHLKLLTLIQSDSSHATCFLLFLNKIILFLPFFLGERNYSTSHSIQRWG